MSAPVSWLFPLYLSIALALGLVLGAGGLSSTASAPRDQSARFQQVLQLIQDNYVDSVDLSAFTDRAIAQALEALDPHTIYSPKQTALWARNRLQGHFEGIGVEFVLLQDTIVLVRVVPNGPSEQAQLRPGDRIVAVNGRPFVGAQISQDSVVRTLRGPQGSQVRVDIQRANQRIRDILITRNQVPLPAIDAAYMLDKQKAYIHLTQFNAQVLEDFTAALTSLQNQGMTQLILDLRDNTGGFFLPAVQLTDLFLPEGDTIVSTKGLQRPDRVYQAQEDQQYPVPVVVLINENTASAAEIVTGALQDNARAWVVGQRSFGKGLVQEPLWLQDSAELRLTIARYYTPKGRCIQQPYRLLGKRLLGRRPKPVSAVDSLDGISDVVGGIVPDQIIHPSTTLAPCLATAQARQAIIRFAANYCASYPNQALRLTPVQWVDLFNICCAEEPTAAALLVLRQQLTQRIAYMRRGAEGLRQVAAPYDTLLQTAIRSFPQAEALLEALRP